MTRGVSPVGSASRSKPGEESRSGARRALSELVDGLEEVDALGLVVHRDDEARAHGSTDLRGLLGADGRTAAHRDEEQVHGAEGGHLLVAQCALPEVPEVRDPAAREVEDEQRVRTAFGAGDLVVLGGYAQHLADRRLQAPGGGAQRHGVATHGFHAVVVEVLVVTSSRSAVTSAIAG